MSTPRAEPPDRPGDGARPLAPALREALQQALGEAAELEEAGVSALGDVVLVLGVQSDASPALLRLCQRGRGSGGHLLGSTSAGEVRTDARTREAAVLAAATWRTHGRALAPLLARAFPHLLLDTGELTAALAARLEALDWTGTPLDGAELSSWLLSECGALDPVSLGERLRALCRPGAPFAAGYGLRTLRWALPARRGLVSHTDLLLTFEHGTQVPVVLRASVEAADRPGLFSAAGAFAVALVEPRAEEAPAEAFVLASWLTLALALRAPRRESALAPASFLDARSLYFPPEQPPPLPNLRPRASGALTLHLSLDAECGQACSFCTAKEQAGVHDGGDHELEAWRLELRHARAHGCTALQLNGVDPLAHSRILALCADARTLGFEELHLMGPGRRLREPAFFAALRAAAPPRIRVTLPLYGTSAASHDGVTGAPGSFDEALAALHAVCAALPPRDVLLATVMTRQNAHQLGALSALAQRLRIDFHVQPVYPLPGAPPQVFADHAAPEDALAEALLSLPTGEGARPLEHPAFDRLVNHPCVLVHAALRQRRPIPWALVRRPRPDLLANAALGYSALPVVPCESASGCTVAEHCPKVHFAAYAEAFSLAAFAPVTLRGPVAHK